MQYLNAIFGLRLKSRALEPRSLFDPLEARRSILLGQPLPFVYRWTHLSDIEKASTNHHGIRNVTYSSVFLSRNELSGR
jgi:hypothetical protein